MNVHTNLDLTQVDRGSGAQRGKTGRLYPRKRNRPGMGRRNKPIIPLEPNSRGYKAKVYHGIEVQNQQMYRLSLTKRIPAILE